MLDEVCALIVRDRLRTMRKQTAANGTYANFGLMPSSLWSRPTTCTHMQHTRDTFLDKTLMESLMESSELSGDTVLLITKVLQSHKARQM